MKRLVDIVGSTLGLLVAAPIAMVAALAIRLSMGRPVLFRQRRIGLHGRPFTLVKFRTMGGESISGREALDDARRTTRLGALLRRSSVDEIPQLWNVLAGDMSLVGPRPLLPEYLALYSHEQRRRHDVLPGITGWAQIHGRNATSWADRLALDTWYVDHWSFRLDIVILWRTVAHLFSSGADSDARHRTMPRFTGREGE